jgi:CxxC motif-containing protein (DUF1111 family)
LRCIVLCALLCCAAGTASNEAPAAFDGASNGLVDDATHEADQKAFDRVEGIAAGLGPLFNAQSCRECHQTPASGGNSQITELRAGHHDSKGRFVNPRVSVADGAAVITGRALINDRAICPSGAFPDMEIQEHVPDTETIRAFRISLNLLGDGFVEAVPDDTFIQTATRQCRETRGRICGLAISVPVLEAPGKSRIGRFGWKDQHASLLSFAADAYLNEIGITSRLFPAEIAPLCDTVPDPEDDVGEDGLSNIDRVARFMRATKAPPRHARLAETEDVKAGSALFDLIGCALCHVRAMETAPAGTKLNGDAFTVPPALGGKVFHPFSDFLLHDVGTGDGIPLDVTESLAAGYPASQPKYDATANRLRTPPLWGVRVRGRLMHDGLSLTFTEAILRHRGEASLERRRFTRLTAREKQQLVAFLRSL